MARNGGTKTQTHARSWLEKAWPEAGEALAQLRGKALGPGELDARTKAFIQLACVSLLRCRHCVNSNVTKLKEGFKATDREIAEAMMVASFAAAGTNLAWAREIFEEHLG